MKIPFRFTIDAYLLRKRPEEYEISKAYYYYTGEMLERKLNSINIDFKKYSMIEYNCKEVAIDLKYNKIDQYTYEHMINNIVNEKDIVKKDIGSSEIELKYNKIKDYEHESNVATIKKEPFMKIIDSDIDWKTKEFSYKPIWNSYFIEWLKSIGYNHQSDMSEEEFVDLYIKDIFCSHLMNEIDELDDNTIKDDEINPTDNVKTMIKQTRNENNHMVEYS